MWPHLSFCSTFTISFLSKYFLTESFYVQWCHFSLHKSSYHILCERHQASCLQLDFVIYCPHETFTNWIELRCLYILQVWDWKGQWGEGEKLINFIFFLRSGHCHINIHRCFLLNLKVDPQNPEFFQHLFLYIYRNPFCIFI